jgi:hypothetical protein
MVLATPAASGSAVSAAAGDTPPLAPVSYAATSAAVDALAASQTPGVPARCHARPHSDFGGELAGGAPHGDANTQADAGACCAACAAHAGTPRCNIWVWHNTTRACWMKSVSLFPERPYVYFNEGSPWTGGSLFDFGPAFAGDAGGVASPPPAGAGTAVAAAPPTCIHTVLTSNGNSCARPVCSRCPCAFRTLRCHDTQACTHPSAVRCAQT